MLVVGAVSLLVAASIGVALVTPRDSLRHPPRSARDTPVVVLIATRPDAHTPDLNLPENVSLLPVHQGICNDTVEDFDVIVDAMKQSSTNAIVVTHPTDYCELINNIATLKGCPLVAWECPMVPNQTFVTAIQPKLSVTVRAVVNVLKHMKFRSASIISIDFSWWSRFAILLENGLMRANITVRNHLQFQKEEMNDAPKLHQQLTILKNSPGRAVVVCGPLRSFAVGRMLWAVGSLGVGRLPQTALLVFHLSPPGDPLPPPQDASPCTTNIFSYNITDEEFGRRQEDFKRSLLLLTLADNSTLSRQPYFPDRRQQTMENMFRRLDAIFSLERAVKLKMASKGRHMFYENKKQETTETGTKSRKPGLSSLAVSLLVQTGFGWTCTTTQTVPLRMAINQNRLGPTNSQQDTTTEKMLNLVNTSIDLLNRHSSSEDTEYRLLSIRNGYIIRDWVENNCTDSGTECPVGFWRSILFQGLYEREKLEVVSLISNSRDWPKTKVSNLTEYNNTYICDEDECFNDGGFFSNIINMIIIAVCSVAVIIASTVGASVVRKQYIKSRMSKGPCKIILTPADFVFPQTQEVKRVEEGIEAMLCCWLHQLQELGGPEIDKPDLLKGSVGSLKSTLKASPSVGSSKVSSDPRARYNGDLVQLKQIPNYGGSFELRSKAIDNLIALHSLRHENVNTMIGCLPDPGRPLLVWEYCSRGSLEDVLMADEIKLDWSFRLSLLTDLVRGMRYLHSSAVRVHGNLTSRNCVIDARWVLKITDFAMPSFYESQNISQPQKKPRDLLWTAPELLRNPNLRKIGTQPGDVYSFSIVMQEVVLRGEPYCTMSLPPEEIIEKIKKPPPLIRPSVSKGAAPPEAINIMRQCWAELPDMRPDFNMIHDLFKTLNHGRKANFVDTMFQMLEKYSNNLEDLIRDRTEQLDMEKKKTEQLLNRMLPSYVAEKLKLGMPVDPEAFSEVTIYFSDIVGFTTISAYSTPFEVVDLLNDLYTCFDATINAYNVYKVETIGDAYMVVGGLPVRNPDHAEQVATMALDLLHHSGKFRIRHLPFTPLRLRIGLHTGPCCAGVVGLTMPRYCLFGDTVNTASRMESSGSAWRIHISESTRCKLDDAGGYEIERRGVTELKGRGQVTTYWLLGKIGFDKQLPTPPPLSLDEQLVKFGRTGIHCNASPIEETDLSNVPIDGAQSLPTRNSKPTGPVYQLSLDAALLANNVESCKKPDRHKWKANRQMTFDSTEDQKSESKKSPEIKSNVSEASRSGISTPFSLSEVNVDILGVSFVNHSKSSQNLNGKTRKLVDENDLSSQYNYYRCISPNNGSHRSNNSRFLKRQYSIDKEDVVENKNRLCKQNSAGAAHDLGRIDEVPSSISSPKFKDNSNYKHRNMPSTISVESLN